MESSRLARAAVLGGKAVAPAPDATGGARGAVEAVGVGAGEGAGDGRAGGGGAAAAMGDGLAGGAGGAGATVPSSAAISGLLFKDEATAGCSVLYAVSAMASVLAPRLMDFVLMRRLLVRTEPRRLGAPLAVGLIEAEPKLEDARLELLLLSSSPMSSMLSVSKSAVGATS